MVDRDEREKPTEPPRQARPPSARPTPKEAPAKPPMPARPTPAREGAATPSGPPPATDRSGGPPPPARPPGDERGSPPPSPEADIEHTTVEVEGEPWIVRVLGRAGSGASVGVTATAPLLLLGFFASERDEVPRREALVVGKALSVLTSAQLERAFETATPPRARTGRPVAPDGPRGPRKRRG